MLNNYIKTIIADYHGLGRLFQAIFPDNNVLIHNTDYIVILATAIPKKYLSGICDKVNIALRRFLRNHGNIATEGSSKSGLFSTFIE